MVDSFWIPIFKLLFLLTKYELVFTKLKMVLYIVITYLKEYFCINA